MATPNRLHSDSVALLTDFYQLTMAHGFWKAGATDKEAVSNFFFRENPFQGGFTVLCGLQPLIEYLDDFHFDDSDIQYLSSLRRRQPTTALRARVSGTPAEPEICL